MKSGKTVKTWSPTRVQGLLRHNKSGRYYARCFAGGREQWVPLNTTLFEVAKSKMGTDEEVTSARRGCLQNKQGLAGKMTVTDAVGRYRADLAHRVNLKESSGAVVEQYSYDAFGKTTIKNASGTFISGTAYGNRFMYTGAEYVVPTGLYSMRNRFYSPTLGRFLQPDPIGHFGDGYNIYRYCANNPTTSIDPNGTDTAQFGAGYSYSSQDWGAVYSAGFAFDNNYGYNYYVTIGAGPSFSSGGSFGYQAAFSNALNVQDLSGPFRNQSFGLGLDEEFTYDAFEGDSADGQVVGLGGTYGFGLGETSFIGGTQTWVSRTYSTRPYVNAYKSTVDGLEQSLDDVVDADKLLMDTIVQQLWNTLEWLNDSAKTNPDVFDSQPWPSNSDAVVIDDEDVNKSSVDLSGSLLGDVYGTSGGYAGGSGFERILMLQTR